MTTPRYMNVPDCSAYTSLSQKTIYLYVSEKRIPHIKVGTRTLFDKEEIDRWLASRYVPCLRFPSKRGRPSKKSNLELR